jgi:hypothetical protein
MTVSERNGTSALIIKSVINFLAKINMISDCLSRILLYTIYIYIYIYTVQITVHEAF